jgi:chitinase
MKFNFPMASATCGLAVLATIGLISSTKAAPPLVMGYYPTYRNTPAPKDIRFDRFTHILHSFLSVDANGKATHPANLPDSTLINTAHSKGAKVLLALGGGSNGKNFGAMVRDPQKNAQFIADAVKIMVDSNSDGLALDWELPTADDKDITTEFVRQMRVSMKAAKPDSLFILVVNSKPNNSKGYDGPKLRDNVDYLHVMTYDFHGPWSHAGHHTPLFENKADTVDGKVLSLPATLTYWRDVQGFRTEQILFGLAGYGRGFKVKDWYEKPTSPATYPEITFRDARALIGKGWTRHWDDEAKAPWLLSDDKSERISYDDEQSAATKARWMKENGLPGFFIWEVTQEYAEGDHLLTAAAQKAWNENAAIKP